MLPVIILMVTGILVWRGSIIVLAEHPVMVEFRTGPACTLQGMIIQDKLDNLAINYCGVA